MSNETTDDRLHRLLGDVRLAAVPDAVRRQLLSIATNPQIPLPVNRRVAIFDTLNEIVADLVHDSLRRISVAGARSGATAPRDIIHRWDDNDLVLSIAPAVGTRHTIQGQIFGRDELRWQISIASDDYSTVATTSTDRNGSFSIAVDTGATFSLILTDDDVAVRCGPISLRPTDV